MVFQSGYTILYSHKQCMGILIFPQFHQYLVLSVFLNIAILVSVFWYVIVVLTCISLMTNNGAHLLMSVLAKPVLCIFYG